MMEIEQLDQYAKEVADCLVNAFYYSKQEALYVVKGYYSVMERIGFFENPKDWAIKINEAMRSNITPDMWHNVL